jgi:glucoamylase
MPLVWAHAEYVKLCRSLADGHVFDMPPQPVSRYQKDKIESPHAPWRFNHKCKTIPVGKTLRIEVLQPARVHWSADNWRTAMDSTTRDTGLGIHLTDLPTDKLSAGTQMRFTFQWTLDSRWEGVDFMVTAIAARGTRGTCDTPQQGSRGKHPSP